MKIRTTPQTQGSVLLATLLTSTIIGIALGSYLTLTSNQNQSVFRAMTWNDGIPVAEAGIEEALTQIHLYGPTNFFTNNWTWGTDGCYHKTRSIGTGGSYFDVGIKPVVPPVITSTAFVRPPLTPSSSFGMILGALNTRVATNSYVKRRVQVNTIRRILAAAGVVAKGTIDFSGQNVQVDSFDSTDSNYNTNGRYDPAKTKANGNVLTNARIDNSITVGNADIKGHVSTGPGGVVTVGSGGSVGDLAWVDSGTQGIQAGYQTDDMNLDIPDVQEPFNSGYFTPVGGKIGDTKYDYILDQTGNYKLDTTLKGKILVTGNATLWVTGNVTITGNDFIQIAPGASLKLYVSGQSTDIGGNGIINPNVSITSFTYFGLPTNTSFGFKANASLTGTVYAPQAAVQLGGGGSDTYDFVGSVVANSVSVNGHLHFHYDEALDKQVMTLYLAASWNEVDANTP